MRKWVAWAGMFGMICLFCQCRSPEPGSAWASGRKEKKDAYRTPVAIAVLGSAPWAVTANHGANSVSLIDLAAGKVKDEIQVGVKPAGIASSFEGKQIVVTNLWSHSVTLVKFESGKLQKVGECDVGVMPRGVTFARDGRHFYVALSGADEVVEVSWADRQITRRWPAPREPREVVVSADGQWLAAASSRSSEVRLWDLADGKQVWERRIPDGFNLRGLRFTPDGNHLVLAHAVRRDLPVTKHNIEEGWVIDTRMSRLAVRDGAAPSSWQVALDLRAQAVADPSDLIFSSDGKSLALSVGGTQELILFQNDGITWNGGDPGDFMDFATEKKTRKIPLKGRPMGMALDPKTGHVLVANYLLDAIQVLDFKAGHVRQINLSSEEYPWQLQPPERLGAALFYDAKRSHHQWMSCNTCHIDGHTVGLNFDTLNDDSYGTPKLTPTLRNVVKTAPFTWHGWQKDLGAAVRKSFTETMFGPEPEEDEVKAVLAYLETFKAPPNPAAKKLTEAAQRGRDLFADKARCARCHRGAYFTSPNNYDVKIEPDGSPFDLWNPPSLIGLFDRGPYMHDGRARTLDDLLRRNHSSEMLGGQELTETERADLIAYLMSL